MEGRGKQLGLPVAGDRQCVLHNRALLLRRKTCDRTEGPPNSRARLPQMHGSLASTQIPFSPTKRSPHVFQLWVTNQWQGFWLSAHCLGLSVILAKLDGIVLSLSSPFPTQHSPCSTLPSLFMPSTVSAAHPFYRRWGRSRPGEGGQEVWELSPSEACICFVVSPLAFQFL